MTLTIGDKAPDFEALDQNGNLIKRSDFAGKKVVIYFYPQDNTPTCTVQACNLRDNYGALKKAGYEVLGVSTDSQKSHQKFIQKHELPFPLLVDEDHTLVNAFGVWQEKTTFGKTYMGTVRTTFVIDEAGIITNIIQKVKSKEHASQILEHQ